MYAVVRETFYDAAQPLQDRGEFKAFQAAHAEQSGYVGTLVVEAGRGHYLTTTLWETREAADSARMALGPTIGRLLNPLMTSAAKLIGTGPIVVDDLTGSDAEHSRSGNLSSARRAI
jgi:hypothetical protein